MVRRRSTIAATCATFFRNSRQEQYRRRRRNHYHLHPNWAVGRACALLPNKVDRLGTNHSTQQCGKECEVPVDQNTNDSAAVFSPPACAVHWECRWHSITSTTVWSNRVVARQGPATGSASYSEESLHTFGVVYVDSVALR